MVEELRQLQASKGEGDVGVSVRRCNSTLKLMLGVPRARQVTLQESIRTKHRVYPNQLKGTWHAHHVL